MWADILSTDSGMCVRGSWEEGGRTLTARRLRHGRHGGLTHNQLLRSSGPDRAPLKPHDHGLLSARESRPEPPIEFISREKRLQTVMAESLETWFAVWLGRYYVVTSPPTSSSSPCERLKNASHSSRQIKGAAGVKGWRGPTPEDISLHWPRLEN